MKVMFSWVWLGYTVCPLSVKNRIKSKQPAVMDLTIQRILCLGEGCKVSIKTCNLLLLIMLVCLQVLSHPLESKLTCLISFIRVSLHRLWCGVHFVVKIFGPWESMDYGLYLLKPNYMTEHFRICILCFVFLLHWNPCMMHNLMHGDFI